MNVTTILTSAAAKFVQRISTSSLVACEKLRRIIFMPAAVTRSNGSACSDVGPIVATILVNSGVLGVAAGSGKRNVVVTMDRPSQGEANADDDDDEATARGRARREAPRSKCVATNMMGASRKRCCFVKESFFLVGQQQTQLLWTAKRERETSRRMDELSGGGNRSIFVVEKQKISGE